MPAQFFRVLENRIRKASPGAARRAQFASSHLELRMFNVGDGEAILLIFPNQRAWLIDCGSSSSDNRNRLLGQAVAAYLQQTNLLLEALVPSHPHKDHAGAYVHLLHQNPALADPFRYIRSDDPLWYTPSGWKKDLEDAVAALASQVTLENIWLKDQHRELALDAGVNAHLFAGSGQGAYTSLFIHLRFHQARLLFTGDSHCEYECDLFDTFGADDFRADVLKVTHHGSSSGTAAKVVAEVKPGLAIASTDQDGGHRLEKDTLARLGGLGNPRRVFETQVDGDIILRTDGQPYGDGLLYQVEFEKPGRLAGPLGATTRSLATVNQERTVSAQAPCN